MTTRREFLGQAGMGLALAATLPTARALGANDRIRFGLIGAGDRGTEDLKNALDAAERGMRGGGGHLQPAARHGEAVVAERDHL